MGSFLLGLGLIALIAAIFDGIRKMFFPKKVEFVFVDYGPTIKISNITLHNNGANCYFDSSKKVGYGRHNTIGDCYWMYPSINIDQAQFLKILQELPPIDPVLVTIPVTIRKVSKKRIKS